MSDYRGLLGVGAGNMLASTIIAGFLLGLLIDQWLGTAPWFMLLCAGLGFVAVFARRISLLALKKKSPPVTIIRVRRTVQTRNRSRSLERHV